MHREDMPKLPNLGIPIPPTDPERAAMYLHPRPGMQVGYAPGDPRGNPYLNQASHYQGQHPPQQQQHPGYPPQQHPQQQRPQQGGGQGVFPQYQQPQPPPQNPQAPTQDYVGAPPVRGLRVYKSVSDVVINGVTYGMRDLGAEDASTIYNLVEEATTWGTNRATTRLSGFIKTLSGRDEPEKPPLQFEGEEPEPAVSERRGEAWILPLVGPFLGWRYVKDEAMALIASVFLHPDGSSVTAEEFTHPSLFPWREKGKVWEALKKHPDLESFFGWFEAQRARREAALNKLSQKVTSVVNEMGLDREQSEQSSTGGRESSLPSAGPSPDSQP